MSSSSQPVSSGELRPTSTSETRLLISTEATRQMLSCGKTELFELIRDKELETVQLGSRRLVVAASVQQFVDRLRQAVP